MSANLEFQLLVKKHRLKTYWHLLKFVWHVFKKLLKSSAKKNNSGKLFGGHLSQRSFVVNMQVGFLEDCFNCFALHLDITQGKIKIEETADLVTFTEEILNGKLHFLRSVLKMITIAEELTDVL